MLTDEKIAELKAKHGDIKKFTLKGVGEFVLRQPTYAEYQRFSDRSTDDKKRVSALEEIGKACIAYPEGKDLAELLKRKPGCLPMLGGKALELAGMVEAEEGEL